ncbi:hypothetical protein H6504_04690 [Candidatus Woesearchaeota archaeon]|nr:hypothetical protein [Candidatus Woesearchaeota archaeon]
MNKRIILVAIIVLMCASTLLLNRPELDIVIDDIPLAENAKFAAEQREGTNEEATSTQAPAEETEQPEEEQETAQQIQNGAAGYDWSERQGQITRHGKVSAQSSEDPYTDLYKTVEETFEETEEETEEVELDVEPTNVPEFGKIGAVLAVTLGIAFARTKRF